MKRILSLILLAGMVVPTLPKTSWSQEGSATQSCESSRRVTQASAQATLDAAEAEANETDRALAAENQADSRQISANNKITLDRKRSEGPLPATAALKRKDRRRSTLDQALPFDHSYRKIRNKTNKQQRKEGISLFVTTFLASDYSTVDPKSKKARQMKREAYKDAIAYVNHEIRALQSDTELVKTKEGRDRLKSLRSIYATMRWRLNHKKYWTHLGQSGDENEAGTDPDAVPDVDPPILNPVCVDDTSSKMPDTEATSPTDVSQCIETMSPAEIQPSLFELERTNRDIFAKMQSPPQPEQKYTHGLEWTNTKDVLLTSFGGSFGGSGDPLLRVFASTDFYSHGDVNIVRYDIDPATGEKIPMTKKTKFLIHPKIYSWEHQRYRGEISTPRVGDFVYTGNLMGGLAHSGSPVVGGSLYVSQGVLPNTFAIGSNSKETHWVPAAIDFGAQSEYQFWGGHGSGIPNYIGAHFGVGSRLQFGDDGFISVNAGYGAHSETASGPGYYSKLRGSGYAGANAFILNSDGKPAFSLDASLYQDPFEDDRLQNTLTLLNVKHYTDIGAFGIQYRYTQQQGADPNSKVNLNPQSRSYIGLTYQYVFMH